MVVGEGLLFFVTFMYMISVSSVIMRSIKSSDSLLILDSLRFVTATSPRGARVGYSSFCRHRAYTAVAIGEPGNGAAGVAISNQEVSWGLLLV